MIDHYAVFGNPIAHSKSPQLQMAFAKQTQQSMDYSAECIAINDFEKAVTAFFAQGGKGLNVTVPFKQKAFSLAGQLSLRAQKAGAVNTLSMTDHYQLVGDNTDGDGLIDDLTLRLRWPIKNKRVLIIGAGGAVRGVLQPLIEQQPASMTIVNRTLSKAAALAELFTGNFSIKTVTFSDLGKIPFDIIVNATSASLSGELPSLPAATIGSDCCCYDMMYGRELTPFLLWAKKQGAKQVSDGIGMLVCQGARSFYIWRGVKPDTATVINQLREQL